MKGGGMKKLGAATLLACVALSLIPARAENRSGTVLLSAGALPRVQRCASSYGSGTPVEQGVFGHTFPVTPDYKFSLKATSPNADFDIGFFVGKPAPCDEGANVVALQWVNHNPPLDETADEIGVVPPDAAYAIISMFAGPPNSSFEYSEVAPEAI
jgi:hypothetical protein